MDDISLSETDLQGVIFLSITAGREIPNAILRAETVHDIFVPALPEKGINSLSDMIMNEGTS